MGSFEILNIEKLGDHRGSLVAIESNNNIPFTLKRIYYLFNTNVNESRGFHAHRNLEQLLVCVHGSCEIKVENNEQIAWFNLDSPTKGLYIKDLVWREMHKFSHDCVLLVVASQEYDELDYIRDYSEFKKVLNHE